MTVTGTRITRNIQSAFLGATLAQDIAYFGESINPGPRMHGLYILMQRRGDYPISY